MTIGGFQKISLSDFPGVISSIIFTRGCGFRCPYCHNPELVDAQRFGPEIPWADVHRFLRSRSGRIEGVVITGGEPTAHDDLPDILAQIRSDGFRIKLDTNGSCPSRLAAILESRLVDFVAMDLKAPLARYSEVARVPVDTGAIVESTRLILSSRLPHEFRTTFAKPLLSTDELLSIAETVRGCTSFVVQGLRTGKLLAADARLVPPSDAELQSAVAVLRAAGHNATAR